jgi:hypothetical protein
MFDEGNWIDLSDSNVVEFPGIVHDEVLILVMYNNTKRNQGEVGGK